MSELRAARVVYHVLSSRIEPLAASVLDEMLARRAVRTGHVAVDVRVGVDAVELARSLPPARDFTPPLDFDVYAKLRQGRVVHRVVASEVEPEDRGYLRAALLVAGEIAATTDGLIVDALAFTVATPADVVAEIDRPFDPLRHVVVHVDRGARPHFVHTHGLEKFGHPDFELHAVPRERIDAARRLLRRLVVAVAAGKRFDLGERVTHEGFDAVVGASEHEGEPHFSAGSLCLCDAAAPALG